MTADERASLIQRMARAMSWTNEPQSTKEALLDKASRIIEEMAESKIDLDRLGWMLATEGKK